MQLKQQIPTIHPFLQNTIKIKFFFLQNTN